METENLVQQVIREEFKNRTVVAIAHRIESILNSDMIAVMENGELAEFAPPEELLGRDSRFKKLYETQKSSRDTPAVE